MYKKIYKPGLKIVTFEGLRMILKKDGVVYLRDKVQAEGWVLNLRVNYLISLMDQGLIKRVIKIDNKALKQTSKDVAAEF